MLVPVEFKGMSKWVRVPKTDDAYNYSEFLQGVLVKFSLPGSTNLVLMDSAGVEVDSDIFDELLKSSQVSFSVFTEECSDNSVAGSSSDHTSSLELSPSPASGGSSSGSDTTIILESTKARKRQLIEGPPDSNTARNIIRAALYSKPDGDQVFKEYEKTNCLSDTTRRRMVNILVADMVESHGRIPPEHFYDHQSGSGYLAWRLKTVQRNSTEEMKKSKSAFQDSPRLFATSQQMRDSCRVMNARKLCQ
ncbi:uncharacterized protein LOC106674467 isoform X4 [Maylandia zebra]|uniref:uncharacterized protein LOC106674467 isoform X4 n=1 Tax=Maylandia zebra TaxID=106582 RepID=UPI00403C1AD2